MLNDSRIVGVDTPQRTRDQSQMSDMELFTIACGVIALVYGAFATKSVVDAPAGNEKMQEIALAIQEGAKAYLNRQYSTIAMVGVVIGILLGMTLGMSVAIGY